VSCIITTDCNITEDSPGVLCPVALTKTSMQWETILKRQSRILKKWSKTSLSSKGKELILKALIQSRALYLATANEMPKSIV